MSLVSKYTDARPAYESFYVSAMPDLILHKVKGVAATIKKDQGLPETQ